MAAGKAVQMGYRNVYWYKGGIKDWKAESNYIESSDFAFRSRMLPRSIEAGQLHKMMQNRDKSIALIDIRDDQTRLKSGIIKGSSDHFPLYRLNLDYADLPANKKLVLIDIMGKQVPSACRYLMNKRFPITRLLWLEGGFSAWQSAGLPMQDLE